MLLSLLNLLSTSVAFNDTPLSSPRHKMLLQRVPERADSTCQANPRSINKSSCNSGVRRVYQCSSQFWQSCWISPSCITSVSCVAISVCDTGLGCWQVGQRSESRIAKFCLGIVNFSFYHTLCTGSKGWNVSSVDNPICILSSVLSAFSTNRSVSSQTCRRQASFSFRSGSVTKRVLGIPAQSPQECKTRGEER